MTACQITAPIARQLPDAELCLCTLKTLPAVGGEKTADGCYTGGRLFTVPARHMPAKYMKLALLVLLPVSQHGSLDSAAQVAGFPPPDGQPTCFLLQDHFGGSNAHASASVLLRTHSTSATRFRPSTQQPNSRVQLPLPARPSF